MVIADLDSALLEYLYRSSLRLLVVDQDGRIEWMTPQAAALLVPLAEDGRVENLFELLEPHLPDLRPLADTARGSVVSSGMSFTVPWRPQPRIFSLDLQWVDADHLLAVLADVTQAEHNAALSRMRSLADRLVSEARLLASDDLLKRLAAQVPGVLFQLHRHVDGSLHLPFVSRAVVELFGVRAAEARQDARVWPDRIDADDRPGFMASLEQSAVDLQTWSCRFRSRGGWRQLHAQPVRQGDGSTIWFGFVADISQQIEAEDRLRQLNESLEMRVRQRTRELAVALDAAEQANRSRGEFLAKMSHEIRTPLNAILGMAHLAMRDAPDDRLMGRLQTIHRSGEHLLGVINDILDFSKIDAGKLELESSVFALRSVMEASLALVGERAREKGLELRVELDADLPERVIGDALRLQQLVLNLLNNAITYTEKGHVQMAVAPVAGQPGWLSFSVTDTGIGLSDEQQSRLFRSFEQADNSMSRRYGGTGLGLAICKQLAGLMQGEVGVRSHLGEGSTFWFTARLPAAPQAEAIHPITLPSLPSGPLQRQAALPPGDLTGLKGRHVLLVEDNAFNQIITREILEQQGCQVTIAEDGQRALDLLQGVEAFDVVLMDVQMPGLDGLETTRRLRAAGHHPRLPVIAMTAHARLEDREACEAAGMDDFITKPVEPARLYERLAAWLGPRALPPEAGAPAASGR